MLDVRLFGFGVPVGEIRFTEAVHFAPSGRVFTARVGYKEAIFLFGKCFYLLFIKDIFECEVTFAYMHVRRCSKARTNSLPACIEKESCSVKVGMILCLLSKDMESANGPLNVRLEAMMIASTFIIYAVSPRECEVNVAQTMMEKSVEKSVVIGWGTESFSRDFGFKRICQLAR